MFGYFGEETMQLLLEVIWNKIEYSLKDSRKVSDQLEDFF